MISRFVYNKFWKIYFLRFFSGKGEKEEKEGNKDHADFEASCNSESPMGIAVAVMHEFMHANFFLELTKMGWDGKEGTFESFWNEYLYDTMAETGKSHHQIITEYYLYPIAEALQIMNGNTGNVEDYYGYILGSNFFFVNIHSVTVDYIFIILVRIMITIL